MKAAAILFFIAATTLALAADKLMDDKLAAKADVVVRAKLLSVDARADKYATFRVHVLQVFKSPPDTKLTNKLSVAAYSWKPGVPDGESTLYLERYGNEATNGLWKLVGGEASTGVSHNTK
ncbi:MAG: hypothetical protein ACTHLW_02815 [Verrucomicrobiota bacterium]